MAVKYFCDQCGDEITNRNKIETGRLKASIGHLGVEVIVSQNQTANDGEYCKYCVLDALYKLDDRPREASA
jgi:hypothetical protein